MATNSIVQTLGAGSGIDIKSLAQNLVDAEKKPQKERIEAKIAQSEAKITGYGAVKFALGELKNAFAKINDASDFNSIQPNNSQPTAFGVTARSTAQAGSHSIKVIDIASAQRTASGVFPQKDTQLSAPGQAFKFQISVGGGLPEEIDVNPAPTEPAGSVRPPATLEAVESAVNRARAKLGVTAQLINTGNGHQIVLSGQTGIANRFSFTTTSVLPDFVKDAVSIEVTAEEATTSVHAIFGTGESSKTVALVKNDVGKWVLPNGIAMPPGDDVQVIGQKPALTPFFNQQLQSASDASFEINGLTVTRGSNTVNDVINGVTLDLFTRTTGAARLDLTRDTAGIKDNMKGLVTAYNYFEDSLKILGDKSSEVEDFGGALAGESLLQTVRTQVRQFITEPPPVPQNTISPLGKNIKAARDVGLSIDRFGKLTLDEGKLDKALQNNFDEVSILFSAGTNNKSTFNPAFAGVAGHAINSIDKMLLSTGLIDTKTKNATTQIAKLKEDLDKLDKRMEMLMTRYMSQFSVMESIVGNSNSMREGLKGTFEGMMKAYGN